MTNYIVGFSTWGSVLAGLVIFFIAQAGFALLGLALGLMPIKPKEEVPPASQLATGAGIWMGVTTLISMFLAGWMASHHAGNIGVLNSVLHGILTWAVAGLIAMSMATTAIGSLFSGVLKTVMSGLKSAAQAAGGAAQQAGPAAAAAVGAVGANGGISPERLRQEWPRLREQFESALKQTGKPELQPEHIKAEAQRAAGTAKQAGQQADTDAMFRQIMAQLRGPAKSIDKDAVANVIEQRTHMDHKQAVATADQWISKYRQTVGAVQEKAEEVREKAREMGAQAQETAKQSAHTIGLASLWSFLLYLLTLGVAVWGSWVGAVR